MGKQKASPVATGVNENTRLKYQVVCICKDLFRRVSSIGGGSKIHRVFDLVKKHFDGLSRIVGSLQAGVVVGKISRSDPAVYGVEMIKDGSRGYIGISCYTMTKSPVIHFVYSSKKLLFQRFVGSVIFAPNAYVFNVGASDGGNLGAGDACWKNGLRSWVHRYYERDSGQSVIDGR